jgi:hypothetical protein
MILVLPKLARFHNEAAWQDLAALALKLNNKNDRVHWIFKANSHVRTKVVWLCVRLQI